MSISFLVEARDVPEGAETLTFEQNTANADTAGADTGISAKEITGGDILRETQEYTVFELADVRNGLASWYGKGFHGRKTASGRRFNMHEMTAAHPTLPFGTLLRVVNAISGDAVVVEVTDRGPFISRRVVDLSYASARRIGISVTPVELAALTPTAIQEFFSGNDTTILVIAQNSQIQIWPVEKIFKIEDCESYAHAASKLLPGEIIMVHVGSDDTISYSRGRVIIEDIAEGG